MSDANYQAALTEAEKLTELSDEALYEELGLRIKDMENVGGYERAARFSADFQQDAKDMLGTKDLKEIGQRWWRKLEPKLMEMVCVTNNEEAKRITGGKTLPQMAASLATAGLVSLFVPPAWLIVAASILAAKITESGLDAVCEVWAESMKNKNK